MLFWYFTLVAVSPRTLALHESIAPFRPILFDAGNDCGLGLLRKSVLI